MTTPSTFNELTLSAPLMIGEAGGKACLIRLLKTISSLVLDGFSLRLFSLAHIVICLNSSDAVAWSIQGDRGPAGNWGNAEKTVPHQHSNSVKDVLPNGKCNVSWSPLQALSVFRHSKFIILCNCYSGLLLSDVPGLL